MKRATPKDLISAAEAQQLLGVSKPKMARLLKEGLISHFPNQLDRRMKLVSRAQILALKPPQLR